MASLDAIAALARVLECDRGETFMKQGPGLTIEGRAFLVACVGITVMAAGVLVMTQVQPSPARAFLDAFFAAMVATAIVAAMPST